MRFLPLFALLIASCAAPVPPGPSPPPEATAEKPAAEANTSTPQASAPPLKSSGPIQAPRFVRTHFSGIAIEAVAFDSRSHRLVVADQAGGPGSTWPDSRAAGKALGGLAAINASFFTPEGQPLGQVVANRQRTGAINRASSLGAGFFIGDPSGTLRLIRRDQFRNAREAIQSGPFLIENDRLISGLSNKQSSARSFIAWDGGSRWVIARSGACSLASLAQALKGQSLGGSPLTNVLNLDGGRSSEIWVSPALNGGPHFERPFWNKAVRNFLVLKPR